MMRRSVTLTFPERPMATWAVGDIQGCATEFDRLLSKISFRAGRDRLVLVGDIVNRGPDSLPALRRAKELAATVVLGNHDLHLLAVHAGVRSEKNGDTLGPILQAPDCDELITWLRNRPVLAHAKGWRVVHAGVDPRWEAANIERWARKVEHRLRGDAYVTLLEEAFGPASEQSKSVRVLNVMTRIRMVDEHGEPDFSFNVHPSASPTGVPWFEPRANDIPTLFGHWAALGFSKGPNWLGIDTGCVWGNQLTAVNLKTGTRVSVPSESRPNG